MCGKTPGTIEDAEQVSALKVPPKRNATTGTSPRYSVHGSGEKQDQLRDPQRFSVNRSVVRKFLRSLRK